jgi:ketosteroid isomerase-like protein
MEHTSFLARIAFCVLIGLNAGCGSSPDKEELARYRQAEADGMANKGLAETTLKAIESKNYSALDTLLTDDFSYLVPGSPKPIDKQGFYKSVEGHFTTFPDWTNGIEDVAYGDGKVFLKVMRSGTHLAPFGTVAATNKKITNPGAYLFTIREGRVSTIWAVTDELGFLLDLGFQIKEPVAKVK